MVICLRNQFKKQKLQSALLKNGSSQPLFIDSHNDHKLGVLTAPKVDQQIYILDVDMREELIQKAVEGVEFSLIKCC